MDLEWLEDFQTIAETGNFSRTAEIRNITQSALSRRIQALETWVGAKLIDRSSYPVKLTEAGDVLLETVVDVVQRLRAVRLRTSLATGRHHEQVVIASSHTVAPELFPSWLTPLESSLKGFASRLEYQVVDHCFAELERGALHFVVCPTSEAPPDFKGTSAPFEVDEMVPVSAPNADGEPLYVLPGSRRRPLPFLSVAPDRMLGGAVRRMLTEHSPPASLRISFESPQKTVVQKMALAGKGVAYLPRATIASDLAAGRLVVAGSEDWIFPFEIRLYRTKRELPALAERLWTLLQERALSALNPQLD